jgi:photosynthetic reaction center cytochrome c subunit
VTVDTIAFLIALLASSAALAQPRQAPAPPKNLQVLPKDTPPQDVLALMQQFTQALGVQCSYCHVQAPPELVTPEQAAAAQGRGRGRGRGQGPPAMDFAADDKSQKRVARAMLTLVNDINRRLTSLPAPSARVRVQCVTCHRGVTDPRQLTDILRETMLTKGDSAAIALYRDLRQRYYGGQAYDFREDVLLSLGRQSITAKKPDDALAFLQLNLEFYPTSVASYIAMAEAHSQKRDRATASKDLEKAIELDPGNKEATRKLKGKR